MDKKIMRDTMLHQLKKFNEEEYFNLSQMIKKRLLALDEFQQAQTIALTVSRFPEVDTRPIIEAAWSMGKQVLVPKCDPTTREMDFRILQSYDSLETVYNGLWEPIVEETESLMKEKIDLQIVPGVIFSDEGYRIGYGGGYYDRYMVDYSGVSIALAFEVQTSQVVPVENHDVPVQRIVTEKRIIHCEKGTSDD